MDKKFKVVGKNVIRQDGLEKVTGQAKFADDIYFPNQLYGVMVRVPVTHAEIQSIDYSQIENHTAVETICDANDISGAKKVGALKQDQPIFAYDKIRTHGDVVCMLVGGSENELLKLKNEVKIEYKELPVLSDPLKSLDADSPLIHSQYKNNLINHYPLRKGDVEKGFEECDHIIEQTYSTPHIEHAYIEPEAVIAIPKEGNKGIHIIGSIQNPFTTRKVVATVLGWPLAKVRIEQAELGGSFGGKDDTMNVLSARAAIAAVKTGRPIKIRYTREDSILESYKRHPYIMNYKVGFNSDGKLKAMKIDITADGGAYASMSPFVTWRSVVQATGPYEIENVWTDVRAVYTNNPYTGAFRGFGSPQIIFAQESLMDEIASQLKMNPIKIREINGYKQGSFTSSGQKLQNHDVNLMKVLQTATEKTQFENKWKNYKEEAEKNPITEFANKDVVLKTGDFVEPEQQWKKGIGLALSFRGCSLGAEGVDAVAAYLSLQPDGSAYLLSGLAENGQGLRTTFSIIAAEIFGINTEDIYYLELDTGLVGDSGPTVASRSTLMGGGAVKNAAEIIKTRLIEVFIQHFKLPENSEIVFENGEVFTKKSTQNKMLFNELCAEAYNTGTSMSVVGWYKGPDVGWDEETGQGDAYFTYVYGCQVAEVKVNQVTGEVFIEKITAVHDPGKVINKLGALGQVYGGVTQGAGYGLWEVVSNHESKVRELNFDQYLIPTSKDIDEIEPIFIEGDDEFGAWGAKSLGEPTLELTAAAIANAIRSAAGKRFYNLPINLEEVLLKRKLYPEDLKRGSA
jgi:CO/xanthine dehydrogenase Mo-binding subunit